MKKNILTNHNGYSLVEICVVIVIMAIALSAVIPNLLKDIYSRYGEAVAMDMGVIEGAARAYYIDKNIWPADINALKSEGYLSQTWSGKSPMKMDYLLLSTISTLSVETDVKKPQVSLYAAKKLPMAEVNGSMLKSTISVPGGVGQMNSYDSGWFPITPRNEYVKIHNLGTQNVITVIYGATDAIGSNQSSIVDSGDMAGDVGTVINSTTISLLVGGNGARILDAGGIQSGYTIVATYLRVILIAVN
ncbi:MAG: prepilin-type N-terminal cleavage/methylation domain-containing protein [Candidatus Omnitrophica bacterium]|nr:prepilin-type N-terminal cleavage/methylation domain-containing protein [Candidatus Omnitrophota bacterium]